ncbi:hypothetical protein, partial [Burkholderia cenocepacia]
ARQPCVLYSVTGSNTQARGKLHGLVWLPPDFTVLVSTEHTSVVAAWSPRGPIGPAARREGSMQAARNAGLRAHALPQQGVRANRLTVLNFL